MSETGRRPRTLLVGPIGPRPWVSRNELVAQLDDLGHDVFVNGVDGPELVLPLDTLPAQISRARNSWPSLFAWVVRMLWRWRRMSNQRLRDERIDHILVWDPILAGLCRLARPAGTEVIWVAQPSDGSRLYQRLLRTGLKMSADRMVVSWEGDGNWSRNPVVLTRWPMPRVEQPATDDDWVLIASPRPPTAAVLENVARKAAERPATAVIFDSREHDRVPPELAAQLRRVSGADAVWWTAGDEWIEWCGGLPSTGVDCSGTFGVDHRHLRMLGAGRTVVVPDPVPEGLWSQILQVTKTRDGWSEVAVREDVTLPETEDAWAAAVFKPAPPTAAELIATHGRAVDECPICDRPERRVVGRTDGRTAAWKCLSCGLVYASHVLPDAILHDASYHTGGAAFGTDYESPVIRGLVEEVADHRLDVLDELRVPPGRLLDVGAGLGHMVHRANERGWEAVGLEVVDEACAIAGRMYGVHMHVGTLESVGDIGRFDVVSFGQTLEHLADPVATLRLVRERFLTPNGRVLIEAPNAQCLARFLQRRKWMHWQPGDHHTYPDLWSTRVMLQRAGFAAELVRSDSLTVKDASELVLAYNLGLLSERTWQLFPPTTRWLVKAKTYTPLKKLTEFVDERGFGQNVVAVGRSLS